ncbi:MAG TPA: hypothetical protein VFW96_22655 [Thermomicrobiales bacterium]|nr:hypothetical protein [Thermomicrobiales bacterium]
MRINRKAPRVLIAAIAVAALALVVRAAPPVEAAGLTNCVELSGRSGACYESVWANGVQLRMTFPKEAQPFTGATPGDRLGTFYVLAPQTATPQGALPFPHDHVVGNAPAQNAGTYVVHLRGFLVLCSAAGIASGGCVPAMTPPFLAKTINGQPLTSVDAIESAANAGLLTLVDTGAVFVATINPGK